MKTINLLSLLLSISSVLIFGCQKKEKQIEDLSELGEAINVEEPTDNANTNNTDPVSKVDYGHCNINFMMFDRMLKKMLMDTYFQSSLVGMPGVKGKTQQLTPTTCPESSLSNNTSYPTTMTLNYGAGCNAALFGELIISGVLEIDFSGPIDQPNTTITLRPQDDFIVSGYDIDISSPNAVTFFTESGFDYTMTIEEGENITMIDPDGALTSVGQISPGNVLLYDNNGTDGGPLEILDDTFWFSFDQISMSCGDGTQLTVLGEEELVYSLECDCIQDGTVSLYERRDLVNTTDFGYPAEEGEEAVCDDEILVTTPFSEQDSEGQAQQEVITCP